MRMKTKTIIVSGLLIALQMILSRFCSISAWNIKIGFGFVPIVLAAILYGPVSAGVVGGLSDFLGAILFPIGPYFPGFTLTAVLTGIVYGIFLHGKNRSAGHILFSVTIVQLGLSLLLNSWWISILYDSPYVPLLATRIIQCAVLAPIEFIVTGILLKGARLYERSQLI